MKIVIAPDAFKESLSAHEVARAIEAGFREIFPHATYQCLPMADGGEGTVQAVLDALGGDWHEATVHDPLGRPLRARFGLTGDGLALIEMAEASGLARVEPARRNPCVTSSRGTGELIRAALDAGARRLLLGIGGSATLDAGAGLLQALGVRLLDAEGRELPPGGAALSRLERIDVAGLDARLATCGLEVACDVDNPLTGPNGAAAVFGPQKGATPAMVAELDAALTRFAQVLEAHCGRSVAGVPGAGAAGGLGAALLGLLGASLRRGSERVADAIGLDAAIAGADLVITGEGRLDSQTVQGKTALGVVRVAARHGCPVIAIAGSLAPDHKVLYTHGLLAARAAVSRICTLEDALAEAVPNLQNAARNVAAVLKLGMFLPAGITPTVLRDAPASGE